MRSKVALRWIKHSLRRLKLGDHLKSFALVGIATLVSDIASGFVPESSLPLIYLIAIVLSAQRYGLWQAITASALAILAWDYFFTQPYHSFAISSERDIFTLVFFMIVALLVSGMTAHIRQQNIHLGQLAEKNGRLYAFIEGLGAIDTVGEIASYTVRFISALLERDVVMILDSRIAGGEKIVFPPDAQTEHVYNLAGADLAAELHISSVTQSAIKRDAVFLPLVALRGRIGFISIPGALERPVSANERQHAEGILGPAAVAIERIWLTQEHELSSLAAETERMRNALLISVSHDLKTPLTTIIGSLSTLEFLGTSGGDDSPMEMASLALMEAQRLDRFITNLLDMTKLELGGLNVTFSLVDVQDVVVSALQRAQSLLQDHRITVHIQDFLPPIRANFDLLEQAIFNVIDNAGKYSPRDTAIELRAFSKRDDVLIEIADHGCGISDQLSKVIFRKFSRVSLGDAKAPGTGLGLAIAKGFLEVMGGTIAAANKPDRQGAIFTISLPAILTDGSQVP